MNRRNQILIAILVLQVIVAAVVLWPRPTASSEEAESLLPGVEADRIVELTITGPEGDSIQLAKTAEGWVLAETDGYPCQEEQVTPLISKLMGLKADRLVTQTSGSHKRLKVAGDEFERRIELKLAEGTRHVLFVGSAPTFGVAHVRADGQDEVYLTSELSAQDVGLEATSYVERTYFSVPRDTVVALVLENANGRFEFEREVTEVAGETSDTWTFKDLAPEETLKDSTVTALFNRAVSVSMRRPLGKGEEAAYGLDAPSAIVTLRTQSEEDGDRSYTLRVGAKNEAENTFIIISSESPYYVEVSGYTVQDFVEKARDDFLELPPTPTPEPTPEGAPEATPEAP
jgi:hypothetical protein